MKTLTAEQFDNLKFMAELLADIRTMIANNNYDADKRARVRGHKLTSKTQSNEKTKFEQHYGDGVAVLPHHRPSVRRVLTQGVGKL